MGQKSDAGTQPRKRLIIGIILIVINIIAIAIIAYLLSKMGYSYKEFQFKIQQSEDYLISNIDYEGTIGSNDRLKFNLQLKENVNNSSIEIKSTSGNVEYTANDGLYDVTISDFNDNFNVYINNITTNSYKVKIENNGETLIQDYLHNEQFVMPTITKKGYFLESLSDEQGNVFYGGELITSDCTLYPKWTIQNYILSFPITDGSYAIKMDDKYISSNSNIEIDCYSIVKFEVVLSKAYSNSDILVSLVNSQKSAIILNGDKNIYEISNIVGNYNVRIDGIELNKYEIIVDNKSYGLFNYGSMVSIVGENLVVSDYTSGTVKVIEKVFDDNDFGGWFIDGHYLMNSFIQDMETNGKVVISGNYSKKWSEISLDSNGGDVEPKVVIIIEGEELLLPKPNKYGYKFVGWFVKLVEVNKEVDVSNSISFSEIVSNSMILYAGWSK